MSLADKKVIGAGFSNEVQIVRVTYDFAVDCGVQGYYDVLESEGTSIVELLHYNVVTAVTSAGSLVIDLGKGDGGVEFCSDVAKATLAINAILQPVAATRAVRLTDGQKIVLGIEVADATAGKIEFVFAVYKAA